MDDRPTHLSAFAATAIGLIGLAAAMGIGRFAFTPMLPLMQAQEGVTLGQGSYLASANYAGYLLGALIALALNPRPANAARLGLAGVAVSTLGMAFTGSYPLWLVLRALAGVASAFVLVGVSAWALAELTRAGRASWSGWVFAGVGSGMVLAGLAVLAIAAAGQTPGFGWLVLGIAATVAAVAGAMTMGGAPPAAAGAPAAPGSAIDRSAWRLVLTYGIFGFGYIIPATFLPACARALVTDPAVFGWAWPVFGLAAAVSTVVASITFHHLGPRRIWGYGQAVMAAGVALPALEMSLATLLVSALTVGGSFMVVTMAGLQEARAVGGAAASRLMAAMTAAFATGQLLGPLTVPAKGSAAEAIQGPSLLAAALLLLTALVLLASTRAQAQPQSAISTGGRER